MEISNAPFLPSTLDRLEGYASFSWVQDGAFLENRQGAKTPIPAEPMWLIGRHESRGDYEVLYYGVRGVSRVYKMSFDGTLWKGWRHAPGFLQRF
jgi:hypothetical protein